MDLSEIKARKKNGDVVTAAIVVGISILNAHVSLTRPNSKYHKPICEALEKIIEAREQLINN